MGTITIQKTYRGGALPGLEERRQIVAQADSVLAEARALVYHLDQMEGRLSLSGQHTAASLAPLRATETPAYAAASLMHAA